MSKMRMRYVDARQRGQTLTWVQWVYLDTAGRGFDCGWGGLASTGTVRLLNERGLIQLLDYGAYSGVGRWRVARRTALGETVLAEWCRRRDARSAER